MSNLRIPKKAIIHYILIYLFLVFHGATIYSLNNNYFELLIEIVCVLLWMKNSEIRKKSVLVLLYILLLLTLIVSYASGSGTGLTFFRAIADQILITYTVIFYDKKYFLKRFFKILSIFAVISLIFYGISLKNPSMLFSLLTERVGKKNDMYYGLILYSKRQVFGYNIDLRNSSIFTEPGIYAVILNSAVYAVLFFRDYSNISSKQRYVYFAIFSFAILSTLSTIAYVVWGIIVIGYIFETKSARQFIKEKRKLFFLCLIFVIFLFVNYYKQGDSSIWNTYVLSKANSNALLTQESSGNARVVTIQTCLSIIKKYPFGAGGNFVTYSLPDYGVAAAFLIYIASLGVINACILYLYFLIPAFKNTKSLLDLVIFIFMYIMLSLAQSQVWYPSLLMFPVMWQSFELKDNFK